MRMTAAFPGARPRRGKTTPTNVSLDATLVAEAKKLGVSISQAASQGLEEAVGKARAERWLAENRNELQSYNDWIESNGLPLEEYRLF
jgi:antitoxin CcdA